MCPNSKEVTRQMQDMPLRSEAGKRLLGLSVAIYWLPKLYDATPSDVLMEKASFIGINLCRTPKMATDSPCSEDKDQRRRER